MNREILFRGKRIDNGEWVEGYFGKYFDGDEEVICIALPTKETLAGSLCYEVDPSTVGQSTGLTDKNGRKIFEGDVLREPAKNGWEKENFVGFEVFWHDNDSCDRHIGWQMNRLHFYGAIGGADIYPISFRPEWAKRMVVIGNIHDNLEFVEGE